MHKFPATKGGIDVTMLKQLFIGNVRLKSILKPFNSFVVKDF
jgi:hypothetical protein